jgi:uncharacterized membrane protein
MSAKIILLDDFRPEIKRSWDLSLIVFLSLILAAFIYLVPDNPIRIGIGLLFILFFPGYALMVTLFPAKKSFDIIERIALSFGLSIAVVTLVCLGLNYTPFGILLNPILWSLILFEMVFSFLGIIRRRIPKEPFLPFKLEGVVIAIKKQFQEGTKNSHLLTVFLVIAIMISLVTMGYIMAMPRMTENYSEFYLLDKEGKTVDYPHNLTVGQPAQVILGISNHEDRNINYSVEIWLSNSTYADNTTIYHKLVYMGGFSVTIDSTQVSTDGNWTDQWQGLFNFSVPQSGEYKIWFVMQIDGKNFNGSMNLDYAGTETQDRFTNLVNSKGTYILDMNLNVVN